MNQFDFFRPFRLFRLFRNLFSIHLHADMTSTPR